MFFFERFRATLERYAGGVHRLGEPAAAEAIAEAVAALGGLPEAYREFLAQWNGGFLFHDDYLLHGVAGAHPDLLRLERAADEPSLIEFGAGPDRRLLFDAEGKVLAQDAETDERSLEGSDFVRWLDATLAREGVLFDREGEFREQAFDGERLSMAARRKRAQLALRIDPEAPAWHEEMAHVLLDAGERGKAAAELTRAVELWPGDAPAWLLLGRLRRENGDAAGAIEAFVRAAALEADREEAAFALASAARAATEAGLEGAADLAARVHAGMPSFVEQQRVAAVHLIEEGDLDGAGERLALAAAVAPGDAAIRGELQRLRARRSLKLV